jgi:thiamine-phosphate pyrophosphorylase
MEIQYFMARLVFPQSGLYVITRDTADHRGELVKEVAAALRGGAAVIQYRAKRPLG